MQSQPPPTKHPRFASFQQMSTPTLPSTSASTSTTTSTSTSATSVPSSPPGQWHLVPLTPSHRPILITEGMMGVAEVEMGMCEGVKIERVNGSPTYGTLIVTTHRLIWLAPREDAIGMWLKEVDRVEQKTGFLGLASSRTTLHTNVQPFPSSYRLHVQSSKNESNMISIIQKALAQKEWMKVPAPALPEKRDFTTTSAGINGIIRSVHDSSRKTDRTLDQAFSDLNALMQNASEIVSLAARFAAHTEPSSSSDEAQFSSLLVSMGIASPVTKRIAGSQYHEQLARQLSDWVQPQLEKNGGLLSLPDVYCLFNRARGTELISPDDLLLACNLFTTLQLPIRLRRFDSGVIVLESSSHTDAAMSARILSTISQHGPVTALQLSTLLSLPLILTQQYLHECEYATYLCRDESLEGVRFYQNIFK